MNRPDNLMAYDELDLKLGIKSSLPHVKGTLALSVLLWECADHPSELVFSEQKDKETVLTQELRQWLSDYLSEIIHWMDASHIGIDFFSNYKPCNF